EVIDVRHEALLRAGAERLLHPFEDQADGEGVVQQNLLRLDGTVLHLRRTGDGDHAASSRQSRQATSSAPYQSPRIWTSWTRQARAPRQHAHDLVLQGYRAVGRDVADQDRERRPRAVVPDPDPPRERRRDVERSRLRVELDPCEAAPERSLPGVGERAPELRT